MDRINDNYEVFPRRFETEIEKYYLDWEARIKKHVEETAEGISDLADHIKDMVNVKAAIENK